MNEENTSRFILYGPPTLDLIRPYARKICKQTLNRELESLDTIADKQKIMELFAEATKEYHKHLREKEKEQVA